MGAIDLGFLHGGLSFVRKKSKELGLHLGSPSGEEICDVVGVVAWFGGLLLVVPLPCRFGKAKQCLWGAAAGDFCSCVHLVSVDFLLVSCWSPFWFCIVFWSISFSESVSEDMDFLFSLFVIRLISS